MARKQKPPLRIGKKRTPFEVVWRELQYLREEIHIMRQLLSILVEKQERQYASAIGISMEKARLRQEKEPAEEQKKKAAS